jgi:Secretion system C-terminal sorting domain
MKKIITLILASCAYVVGIQAQIFSDDFSAYTTGTQLTGQGAWTNNSSTAGIGACAGFGCTNTQVAASTMAYVGYGAATKAAAISANYDNVGRIFTNTNAGPVYVAFLLKLTSGISTATGTTAGEFFRIGSGTGFSGYHARIYANAYSTSAAGSFKISASKQGVNSNLSTAATVTDISKTHLVIIKYTINSGTTDDKIDIFVDPIPGASEPTPDGTLSAGTDGGATGTTPINRMIIRSGDATSPTGQLSNIQMTTSWASLFPTCFAPSTFIATPSFTTADLSWAAPTGGSAPTGYDYEVSTSSTFAGSPIASGSPTSAGVVSITGLTAATTYYARVRTNCGGGDLSAYATTTFTTLTACKIPTSVNASGTTITTSNVTWSQIVGSQTEPTAWDYELVLNPAAYTGSPATPSGVMPAATGVTSPLALTALTSASSYGIKVRANCGASGYSLWTAASTITTPASCLTPFSLVASAITTTTATVDWTQTSGSVSGEPTMWDYEINSTNVFTGTPTSTTAKPLNLTGLMGATTYYVKVRASCGASDKSAWSSALSFVTACSVININTTPYTEGFEATTTGNLPPCWNKTTISSTPSNFVITSGYSDPTGSAAKTGAAALKLGYNSGVQRVTSPIFDASGLTTVELSFDASEDPGFSTSNDNSIVQYSTNGTTWTAVTTLTRFRTGVISSGAYNKRFVVLPAAAISSTLQFAFYHTGANGNNIYIDNIRIGSGTAVENGNTDACEDIPTNASSSVSAISGKNWFRYHAASGNLVAEINPNGNTLTAVAVKLRDYPSGSANVPTVSGAKLLPHIFSIKPTGTISAAVGVRLYFNDAELADYNTAAGFSKTIAQLGISKKTVATENCDPNDNGATGGTSITPTAVDYGSGFYLEFTTTTFSEFAAADAGVILSAELTKIAAKNTGVSNRIDWTTATEKDVNRFDIERSHNGIDAWQAIGSVHAIGNATAENNYTFIDKGPLSISYYRVRILDNDGKNVLSKTVSVVRSVKALTVNAVSPMPVTDIMSVDYAVSKAATVTVMITDILGKTIKQANFDANEGINKAGLDVSGLTSGTYILTVNDGETVVTNRIVKQ